MLQQGWLHARRPSSLFLAASIALEARKSWFEGPVLKPVAAMLCTTFCVCVLAMIGSAYVDGDVQIINIIPMHGS
jgi:hypothetical protein